jgi:alkanesulfonate monooxygenase SsuD/methylene tetrahydromethanopterin reductase-like flavin-dependent oxidoreductase (luciferase family)
MVTPLARRRTAKVARETATLNHLSGGRPTLGVGLGSDRFAREDPITRIALPAATRAAPGDPEVRAVIRTGPATSPDVPQPL